MMASFVWTGDGFERSYETQPGETITEPHMDGGTVTYDRPADGREADGIQMSAFGGCREAWVVTARDRSRGCNYANLHRDSGPYSGLGWWLMDAEDWCWRALVRTWPFYWPF